MPQLPRHRLPLLLLPALAALASARPAVTRINSCDGDRRGNRPLMGWLSRNDPMPMRPVCRLRGGGSSDVPANTAALSDQFKSWWAKKSETLKAPSVTARKDPNREKAAALMRQRGLDKCEKAVNLLREALKKAPDDVETGMELADALNAVMRIKTNANALIIDGSLDTPANKRVWKVLGDEALPLAKQAYEARLGDVKALAVYADAFMFSCSAKGIVKQALSGTAKEYKRVANELRKYPKWDGGVGLIFLGGLYNVAPWPVGNKPLAKKLLGEAASLAPTRRNLYYVGVNAFQLGEYQRAVNFFERALRAQCGSATEMDFGDFLLREARTGLTRATKAMEEQSSNSS